MQTRFYFTDDRRRALSERARREGRTVADLVREAVEDFLRRGPSDPQAVLDATFGAIPDMPAPCREGWDRGDG